MTIRILILMLLSMTLVACDRQGADWEEAQQEDSISSYESFVESYPDSSEADGARSRIEALRAEQAWADAQRRDSITAYREFLEAQPDAASSDEARGRLQDLEREVAWQDLSGSDEIDALRAFADDHAGSPEAELAHARVAELQSRAQADAQRREQERERQRQRDLEIEAQRQAEQGTHRVQLAVVGRQDQANSGIEQLQQRLADVLGDTGLEAQPTNGMYRLVTRPMSREQAEGMCQSLKQRGQDCLVRQR